MDIDPELKDVLIQIVSNQVLIATELRDLAEHIDSNLKDKSYAKIGYLSEAAQEGQILLLSLQKLK
jgi:hypothetical protein